MHEWSAILRRNRTLIVLFVVMVLLPCLFLTFLSVRAIKGEDAQQRFRRAERQRQVAQLLEADLNEWLFARGADAPVAQSLFRFTLDEGRLVFPDLKIAFPLDRTMEPGPVPWTLRDREPHLTDEAVADPRLIEEIYYPRILAFLRDLQAGRNGGAFYFLRLKSMIVLIPGTNLGYVLGAARVIRHVNSKLEKLTALEDFRGTLSIVLDQTTAPAGEAVAFSNRYPFFRVIFARKEAGDGALNVRNNLFLYSTVLFLLVTALAGIFMYRAVSQEITVSRLKADFVSAVSHEFRTPLSSILALTERLDSDRVIEKDALRQYHATLRRDAHRLSLLVEKLLDFAQLEEGKKQFSLDRINLANVAAEAVSTFQPSGASQSVHLVDHDESPQIVGDKTAVVQCLQNLIENAIKYSPPGSPVTVGWGRENGKAFLEVRDRGIGIPVSDRHKIFEKFYRAPNARAWHAQGTGIGLALVQRIIDIHGGSILVESSPGEGSRFRLVFPESARS